ncbi:EF-hand domain-containing protein [bacterium]|nr:EF-hand domain-containing protein [bacterium]
MLRRTKSGGARGRVWVVATLVGALALAAAPDVSRSADADGRPPRGGPLLLALDADNDGALSAAEISNAVEALLTLDANGDGALSASELLPPEREGGRPPRARR